VKKVLRKREHGRSKHCKKCSRTLGLSQFGNDKTSPDGLTRACKACRNTYQRRLNKETGAGKRRNDNSKEYRKRYYADEGRKRRYEDKRLQREFGISIETYEQMYDAQKGRCGICDKPETSSRAKKLAVDHCHETGKVRGLLCQRCNRALGLFKDNYRYLEEAVSYLRRKGRTRW
jgi:ribosomal protein L19E